MPYLKLSMPYHAGRCRRNMFSSTSQLPGLLVRLTGETDPPGVPCHPSFLQTGSVGAT
jgi:hypothetical protein